MKFSNKIIKITKVQKDGNYYKKYTYKKYINLFISSRIYNFVILYGSFYVH